MALAQLPSRQYTVPPIPPEDALARLNLALQWHAYLPMDGVRDGIYSTQIQENQLLFQLRSGRVVALDSATGAEQWRNQVGVPYTPPIGFGSNSDSVFIAKGVHLFALDRATGAVQWEYEVPNVPAAAAVSDDRHLYLPTGNNRLLALLLPDLKAPLPAPVVAAPPAPSEIAPPPLSARVNGALSGGRPMSAHGVSGQSLESISAITARGRTVRSIGPLSSALQANKERVTGPQPQIMWEFHSDVPPDTRLETETVITQDFLLTAGTNGVLFALSKYAPRELYRFQTDAPISASLGQYGEIAYIASEDFRIYALNIVTGRVLWRFVGGGPILRTPRITDDDIYFTAQRAGLYRLDRRSGAMVWRNGNADRFIAVNRKFVYATDRDNRLLILDRNNGEQLAVYAGTIDFVVPLSNTRNDRLYLASNDGLVLCLHDRDYPTPLVVKNIAQAQPAAAPPPPEPQRPAPARRPESKPEASKAPPTPDK
jgi:outer membrane protein assembly factor BamB